MVGDRPRRPVLQSQYHPVVTQFDAEMSGDGVRIGGVHGGIGDVHGGEERVDGYVRDQRSEDQAPAERFDRGTDVLTPHACLCSDGCGVIHKIRPQVWRNYTLVF
ncbi:hypothetical protein [Mycolicibacterium neoaurum]|uniref:hypothetical protein n=1 Tax=Mycolicibacterium neoaurum TaxID=1795 RepID=UPI0032B2BBBE